MMVEQVRRGVCDRRHTRFATGGLLIADWPEAHAALILWWHSSLPLLASPEAARPFRRRHWLVAKRRTAVVFRFRFCCIRRGCAKHCGGFPYGRSRFWSDAAHLHARRYGRWFELII